MARPKRSYCRGRPAPSTNTSTRLPSESSQAAGVASPATSPKSKPARRRLAAQSSVVTPEDTATSISSSLRPQGRCSATSASRSASRPRRVRFVTPPGRRSRRKKLSSIASRRWASPPPSRASRASRTVGRSIDMAAAGEEVVASGLGEAGAVHTPRAEALWHGFLRRDAKPDRRAASAPERRR